jgi:hypothetical protein
MKFVVASPWSPRLWCFATTAEVPILSPAFDAAATVPLAAIAMAVGLVESAVAIETTA